MCCKIIINCPVQLQKTITFFIDKGQAFHRTKETDIYRGKQTNTTYEERELVGERYIYVYERDEDREINESDFLKVYLGDSKTENDRDRHRETERDTERDRVRQSETERDRERQRKKVRKRERY